MIFNQFHLGIYKIHDSSRPEKDCIYKGEWLDKKYHGYGEL